MNPRASLAAPSSFALNRPPRLFHRGDLVTFALFRDAAWGCRLRLTDKPKRLHRADDADSAVRFEFEQIAIT